MIKTHPVAQGSPEWLELRKGLYTGSNAHKLLKFGTIDYSKNADSTFNGNFYTKRGHILEDEAIDLYQRINRVVVERPGFVTNSKYPGCGYSPDGLTADRTIEVKCFNEEKHRAAAKYIPLEVKSQGHFGMLICEKKLCDLILYNPELPASEALIVLTIRQNPAVQANLRKILKDVK